ncbi:MAG: CRISPR-associated endonuclease Cas1 [Deltaproteobacteria bacterium]|nr:CRISPR-associated endonuclease Cas1 [Deltaproteobacteria bacterium]
MANLYLTEQGSVLKKTGDRIIVQKEDEVLLDVPCNKIEAVLIFGNVQFTTQAVHELFENGIEMAILTRTGRLIGQLTSPATKNIELRVQQFKKYEDETFKLNFSKSIVQGKITNSLQMLRSFYYNHPEINLKEEIAAIEKAFLEIPGKATSEELNGVEGIAARYYFSGFGKMILGEFGFNGRKKYPAPDPVNGLLSLGYTMIFNEISSLLDGMGFDPYLGYFHKIEYGRASLASDLQEEFRAPLADRLTLKLINNRVLKKDDFYKNPKGEGVYLTREAMKRYFAEYEDFTNHEFIHPETKEKTTLRKCFRIQIEKLASFIKGEKEYQPFLLDI